MHLSEQRIPSGPTNRLARAAGLFYLLTFLTGAAAAPASRLIVPGDAARSSSNILANTLIFHAGYTAYLLNVVVYLVVTVLFYELFKRVNRGIALLAVFFSLSGCMVQAAALAFYVAPLVVLSGAPYLAVFRADQLQALALLLLQLHAQAYNSGLALFGFYCVLIGVLILHSTFLPRTCGVLMVFAGIAWLTFLWPPLAAAARPYNLAIGVLGESALTLWLLIMGVQTGVKMGVKTGVKQEQG